MSTPDAALAAAEDPPFDCRKCGKNFSGQKADDAGWCQACRAGLIRRSTRGALLPSAVVAAAYLWLLWWSGLLESPLMAFWVAVGGVLVFVVYKVARRVLFDMLRGRISADGRS